MNELPSWKRGAGVAFELEDCSCPMKRAESRVASGSASGMHLARAGEDASIECTGNLVEASKSVKNT